MMLFIYTLLALVSDARNTTIRTHKEDWVNTEYVNFTMTFNVEEYFFYDGSTDAQGQLIGEGYLPGAHWMVTEIVDFKFLP